VVDPPLQVQAAQARPNSVCAAGMVGRGCAIPCRNDEDRLIDKLGLIAPEPKASNHTKMPPNSLRAKRVTLLD